MISSRTAVKYIFIGIYALLIAYVMLIFITARTFTDAPRIASETMIDGTAARPFVYRMVIPELTWVLVKLTPAAVEEAYNDQAARSKIYWYMTKYDFTVAAQRLISEPKLLYTRTVLGLVMTAFISGYVLMQYRLARYLVPQQWSIALFAPVVGLVMMPAVYYPQFMIYDPAVLFFSAICYYYMAKQQWRSYLFCFFLATLSKETSIFMVVFYSLYYFSRLPRREFIRHLLRQLVVYGSAKLWLSLLYINNIGEPLEDHLKNQISYFLHPNYSLRELCTFFVGLYIIFFRWQEKPLFARYSLWIVLAIFIAYIFYGNPEEYRVFFDAFPLLAILVADTLVFTTCISAIPFLNREPSPNREASHAPLPQATTPQAMD